MTTLTCPKCRRGLPDDALDAGQCPHCGFPLDGPVVLTAPAASSGARWLVAGAVVLLLGAAAVGGYAYLDRDEPRTAPLPEVAAISVAEVPAPPALPVAPLPHEPKPAPPPPAPGDVAPPVEPPKKKGGPRPVGVVMKVDPKIAPTRHFDHPDDTAALPDLNTGDRVTLTGKVRVLRLGAVNGKGVLDASGLVAEEVVITGDLGNEAQVLVSAPRGAVTVGGYVTGAAKLTIAAPGGAVVFASSGRLSGSAVVTATAKRFEVKCPMSGTARANVTLTAAGALKLGLLEDGATVTYKKAAATDPPPAIDRGDVRGAAKVVAAN